MKKWLENARASVVLWLPAVAAVLFVLFATGGC